MEITILIPMGAGLWSQFALLQNNIPCRHSERRRRESAEPRLNPRWKFMDRDGHADLQHVALVDPHRRLSAVRLQIDLILINQH